MLFQHNAQTLKNILEQQHPNFAYEVLTLEIMIGNQQQNQKQSLQIYSKVQQITKLIGMYMLAVQVLQGSSDTRYIYFNQKIQTMMTKKHIIQQLHKASTGKKIEENKNQKNNILAQSLAAKQKQRRSQYDLQIFFNKEQFDTKKVKQMLQNAQIRYSTLQSSILSNLKTQQQKIQERIKKRKMKSQSGLNTSSPLIKLKKRQKNNIQIFQEDQFSYDGQAQKGKTNQVNGNGSISNINYVRNRNSKTGLTQKKMPILRKQSSQDCL